MNLQVQEVYEEVQLKTAVLEGVSYYPVTSGRVGDLVYIKPYSPIDYLISDDHRYFFVVRKNGKRNGARSILLPTGKYYSLQPKSPHFQYFRRSSQLEDLELHYCK